MTLLIPKEWSAPASLEIRRYPRVDPLFLTSEVLWRICLSTNACSHPRPLKKLKKFPLLTPRELQTWLGIHIYMTCTPSVAQRNYWRQDAFKGPLHLIMTVAMSRNHWEIIIGVLHVSDPQRHMKNLFGYVSVSNTFLLEISTNQFRSNFLMMPSWKPQPLIGTWELTSQLTRRYVGIRGVLQKPLKSKTNLS